MATVTLLYRTLFIPSFHSNRLCFFLFFLLPPLPSFNSGKKIENKKIPNYLMDGSRRRGTRSGDEQAGLALHDGWAAESTPTEWTDEKHSLYLKSMEATFVDQLYNSMDLLGWGSENEISIPRSTQQQYPSGEFKVLRGGCWEKINFHRSGAEASAAEDSHVHLKSPWIQHFRSTRKSQTVTSPASQEISCSPSRAIANVSATRGAAASPKHPLLYHSYSCERPLIDSNAEMSDQNFVDEDIGREMETGSCSSKRLKTLTAETSSNDQVVPYGKLPVTED